jgi:hypothetical protein
MTYCSNCGGRRITSDAVMDVNTGEFWEQGDDLYCHECGECDPTEDRHEAAKARLEMRRWRAKKVASCDRCHGEGRIPLVVGAGAPGAGSFARYEPCPCGGAS